MSLLDEPLVYHVTPRSEDGLHDLSSGVDPVMLCRCKPRVIPVDRDDQYPAFVVSHNLGLAGVSALCPN